MDVVEILTTIIKQNPKTWAWNYSNIVRAPYDLGISFRVNAKLNGYVMILYSPTRSLYQISFYDFNKIKILEKEDVEINQIVHVIHREVFKLQNSSEILMYCNSVN